MSDWLARFICCNNAPDAGVAEALTEKNRLPATSDMANQSCFITAIAFLKFEFLAPVQRLAVSVPAQTEAVRSAVGAAVRNPAT
ncbi:hypothetical protein D3C73_1441090 [compost metagenome]